MVKILYLCDMKLNLNFLYEILVYRIILSVLISYDLKYAHEFILKIR